MVGVAKPHRNALTPQQEVFVTEYLRSGGNGTYAAERAGYAHPERVSHKIRQSAVVKSALEARLATVEYIQGAAPECSKDLVDRIAGRKGPVPSHGEAAKLHSVYWKIWSGLPGEKLLSDMDESELTLEQLQVRSAILEAEIERVQASLAARAKPVEAIKVDVAAPDSAQEMGAVDDIFE